MENITQENLEKWRNKMGIKKVCVFDKKPNAKTEVVKMRTEKSMWERDRQTRHFPTPIHTHTQFDTKQLKMKINNGKNMFSFLR